MLNSISLFLSGPGLLSFTTCIVWGTGWQIQAAPLLKMASFPLPTGIHPPPFFTVTCLCSSLLSYFQVILSLAPTWTQPHGGAPTVLSHQSLRGAPFFAIWMWNPIPSSGPGVGKDTRVLKKTFWGQTERNPSGVISLITLLLFVTEPGSSRGPCLPLCVCHQNEF